MDAVVDKAAAQLEPLMNASFGGFTYHNCTPPLCLFWYAPPRASLSPVLALLCCRSHAALVWAVPPG